MCTHTCVKNGSMAISFQWEGEEVVRKVHSQNFLGLGMWCSGSQEINEHQQEKNLPSCLGVTGRGRRWDGGPHLSWALLAADRPGTSLLSREGAENTRVTGVPSGWRRRSGPLRPIRQLGWDCCLKEDDMDHQTVSKKLQSGLGGRVRLPPEPE